jgi:outer membrane protein TolC
MSGSSEKFRDTFIELKDQEVIGVQLNIPILDWGLARGRVRMAEARAQTTRNRLEQNMIDYRQDLLTQVMQFNNQRSRCEISKRAADLAEESYELALKNFSSSSMTMTQLDQLKEKRDDALSNYVSNVADFWNFYFTIRRTTLYDPESGKDISVEFDNLIK